MRTESRATAARSRKKSPTSRFTPMKLADKLDIDLLSAMSAKIEKNDAKYSAEQVNGSSKKYSEYGEAPE